MPDVRVCIISLLALSTGVMDVATQVKTNLVHYNLWHDVEIHNLRGFSILSGIPPNRLDENDQENQVEWVVPESMDHTTVSMDVIGGWFDRVAHVTMTRPKRVTMAVVNDDGTVVYYFVHDGVVKPRQN